MAATNMARQHWVHVMVATMFTQWQSSCLLQLPATNSCSPCCCRACREATSLFSSTCVASFWSLLTWSVLSQPGRRTSSSSLLRSGPVVGSFSSPRPSAIHYT